LTWADEQGIEFAVSVSADMSEALAAAVRRLPESAWSPYRTLRDLFSDDAARWRHFAVVTNLSDWGGERLLRWHREKQGTVEHGHGVIKRDLAAGATWPQARCPAPASAPTRPGGGSTSWPTTCSSCSRSKPCRPSFARCGPRRCAFVSSTSLAACSTAAVSSSCA